MATQVEQHLFKGMQRDLTRSKFSPEFAFDAMNIRLTAREDNTLLSVTNEKGTKEIPLYTSGNPAIIEGTIVGHNVLNNYITLFTTDGVDRIYRLEYKGTYFEVLVLYDNSKLGFSTDNPIESLGVFENDSIQKVYWVDGKNQPRVINIAAPDDIRDSWSSSSFDFVQELSLQEEVIIKRNELSSGLFAPGTIQYAFTYYNKYGQESNIFYTSTLNYISSSERGSSPENRVSNSFDITINNVDTRFEYIRIYSIHRTSIDATPIVLKVIDLPVNQKSRITSVNYTDNGTSGTAIDPTELLYIGGESIIAGTMTQKDNTLFLGNITLDRSSIPEEIKNSLTISTSPIITSTLLKSSLREVREESNFRDGYYKYTNFLSSGNTAGFKSGEHYRLGVQFQHKTGKWSEPIFIGDYRIDESIRPDLTTTEEISSLFIPQVEYSLSSEISNQLIGLGYKKARAVVVFPSLQEKRILVQGMLCPTVFNFESRNNNTPFSQSSWFLRPFLPWDVNTNDSKMDNNQNMDKGAWVEFRHHYGLINGANRGAEIQNITHKLDTLYSLGSVNNADNYSDLFMVDQSILTMHSPDIEFDSGIQSLDYANLQMRIVGAINFTASIGDIDIQTSSPVVHPTKATGFVHKTLGITDSSDLAARSLVSGLFYKDWLIDDDKNNQYGYYVTQDKEAAWMVYPWQKSGSINNDVNIPDRARSSVLSKKKISNLKFSGSNTWFKPYNYWKAKTEDNIHNGITNVQLFSSNEVSLVKVPIPENSLLKNINYYGNIDTLLASKDSYDQYFTGYDKDGSKWLPTTFYDKNFSTIADAVSAIGDYNENLEKTKDPVRMKYKSTPHFVFSMNYTSGSNSQVILPTTYGAGNYAINTIDESIKPFWIDKLSTPPSGDFIVLKWVSNYDINVNPVYPDKEWEEGDYMYNTYSRTLYQYYPYTGSEFPFQEVDLRHMELSLFKYEEYGITHYYDVRYQAGKYVLYEYATSESGDAEYSIKQDVIPESVKFPYLFLAELYRDDSELINAFGGTSEDAFRSNIWLPAGESVILSPGGNNIKFIYGDTWYQRYDCLKTYPFTLEDENSVVEIGSFMCETRVNIDGRYDRNRGQISNLNMTPNNFNLINPIYSQKDNFFNYRVLDKDYYKLNKFNNTITWTKEKQLGSDIDIWTNITMASTLDLDGDKGEITSLNTYNNEIYCFQKNGFSNILFNSRVQIPTSDGVPIEITNGLKVQGKRYINNYTGCSNKWSITETPSGIYFIDNSTDSINLYNGQITSLSDNLGFSKWMKDNSNQSVWNLSDFNNFITYYDKANSDVYFVGKDQCLCYSETLGQFTSFMSYENVYPMFNVANKFYSFKNNKLWEHFSGDYNMFYGEFKPYYITFVANSNSNYDKIFNTLEFRADSWDNDIIINDNTFNQLDVWNEYQRGSCSLNFSKAYPSSLKKKFRIWRANIPRDNSNNRDRIRNTWAYIKLGMNIPNTWKTIFHDASVYYFM